jgi:MFS family permease
MLGLSVTLGSVIGAITGEKTTFLFKEQLHLSASQLGSLAILLGIPQYIQPFLGAWADLKPFFGYHRRSYYLLANCVGIVAYLGMAFMHQYRLGAVASLLLTTGFFTIFSSVIVNASMVEIGNATGKFGRLQSLMVFIPYVLNLAYTGHLSGFVAQNWSYERAYSTAAALFLLYIPLTLLIPDHYVSKDKHATETAEEHAERIRKKKEKDDANLATLKVSMKSPGLWALVGFIAYLIITPGPNTIYYFTDGLHLSKQFIGDATRWGSAGALAGMALFALFSPRLPVLALVLGAWLMDCFSYPCYLLMFNSTTVCWMLFLVTAIGIIYGLCLNALAARASPPGLEGTVYGLVMAAIAFAGNLSGWLGNWIYDYFGPENHHTVTYGWNASLWFGLAFTVIAGVLIPFMPAWARSRELMSTNVNAFTEDAAEPVAGVPAEPRPVVD